MGAVLRSPGTRALLAALREARLEAGLTQAELAARLGRPQSFVSKVEAGERRLDLVETIIVARHLRIEPRTLLEAVEAATPQGETL